MRFRDYAPRRCDLPGAQPAQVRPIDTLSEMADSVWAPTSGSVVPAARVTSRHSAVVRVTHWITTLCFLALLVSGVEILISHPRFYWGETGNVLTPPLFQLPIPASKSNRSHRLRLRAS